MAASGVLVEERSNIVNETGNKDQGSSLRLFLDYDARWCENQRLRQGVPQERRGR